MHLLTILLTLFLAKLEAKQMETDLNGLAEKTYGVKINKCCEKEQIMVDLSCRLADSVNQSKYRQVQC